MMLFAHLNFNTSFNTSLNSIAFPLLRPHFSVTYRPHLAGFSPTYIFIFTLAVVVSGPSTNVLVCSLTFAAQHSASSFASAYASSSTSSFHAHSLSGSDNWPAAFERKSRALHIRRVCRATN